jgi:hypothetical protein
MKKAGIAFVAALVLVALGAAFFLSGREFSIRIPEHELQQKLNARLPVTRTYFFLFQVALANPRIKLVNGSHRVAAGMDIVLNMQLGGEARPLGDSIDVSGDVKYDPARGEFFLAGPVIEHLAVQGIPPQHAQMAVSALGKALADYYAAHPIYALRPADTKHALAKLLLKRVTIENRELVVTVGI